MTQEQDERDRFSDGEFVFVRARVVRHGSTYALVKGTSMESDWLLAPIDARGNEVASHGCIWADPTSVVSVAEARSIVKGHKR
jgi:hypothetical protein